MRILSWKQPKMFCPKNNATVTESIKMVFTLKPEDETTEIKRAGAYSLPGGGI